MCVRGVCVYVRGLTVNCLLNVWLPANKKKFRFTYMKITNKIKNKNSYCMHVCTFKNSNN